MHIEERPVITYIAQWCAGPDSPVKDPNGQPGPDAWYAIGDDEPCTVLGPFSTRSEAIAGIGVSGGVLGNQPTHEEVLKPLHQRWGELPPHPSDDHVVRLAERISMESGDHGIPAAVGLERLFREVILAYAAGMRKATDMDAGADMLELAWGIIANAHGGNWDAASIEWRGAAEKWRDRYLRGLNSPAGMFDREKEIEGTQNDPRYWVCVFGPIDAASLPEGADLPMRKAVREAANELFNGSPTILNTGWSARPRNQRRIMHATYKPATTFPELPFQE